MPTELMKHTCGNCTLCCKLLGVKELEKPYNIWCDHCAIGKGCKIYNDRPHSCREFECGWLLSNLSMEFRPDNLHIVMTGEADGAVILHVDPKYPNSILTKNGKKLLDMIHKNDKAVILVIGDKRKLLASSFKHLDKVLNFLNSK